MCTAGVQSNAAILSNEPGTKTTVSDLSALEARSQTMTRRQSLASCLHWEEVPGGSISF